MSSLEEIVQILYDEDDEGKSRTEILKDEFGCEIGVLKAKEKFSESIEGMDRIEEKCKGEDDETKIGYLNESLAFSLGGKKVFSPKQEKPILT